MGITLTWVIPIRCLAGRSDIEGNHSGYLDRKSSTLRLGTYNVLIPRTDTHGKGLNSWLSRREAVVKTIEGTFDFVGLQECSFLPEHDQGGYILQELTGAGWNAYLPSEEDTFADEFHGRIPILWRDEVFTLETAGQLLLSSWSEKELSLVPILEDRYASYVSGRLTASGRPLLFVTLHLQHTTETAGELETFYTRMKRLEAHMALAEFLRGRPTGELIFVAGDFNCVDAPKSFEGLLTPAEKLAKTTERWSHNSFHDWEYPLQGKHLDKIFISEALAGGVLKIGSSKASDHYPVSYLLPTL